jgi:hypothetical protein
VYASRLWRWLGMVAGHSFPWAPGPTGSLGRSYCAGRSGMLNASMPADGVICSSWTSTWRRPWRSQGASNEGE